MVLSHKKRQLIEKVKCMQSNWLTVMAYNNMYK